MGCDYYIYDNEDEQFLSILFAAFEGAEDYISGKLGCDFERYVIYKRVS